DKSAQISSLPPGLREQCVGDRKRSDSTLNSRHVGLGILWLHPATDLLHHRKDIFGAMVDFTSQELQFRCPIGYTIFEFAIEFLGLHRCCNTVENDADAVGELL